MDALVMFLAVGAALLSAGAAWFSWCYNREITQAVVSLSDVKVAGNRIAPKQVKIDFLFLLKNTGAETLKILELRLGHYSFSNKVFEHVGKRPILNPIHKDAIFNYNTSFITTIDPKIPNEAIGIMLPKMVGKHALILALKYQGQSSFSKGAKQEKYYLGYEGGAGVYQLTEQEYEQMKDFLPSEFKKD